MRRYHAGQASSGPHCPQIPQAEDERPRKDFEHGVVSIQEDRQRRATGVQENSRATRSRKCTVVVPGRALEKRLTSKRHQQAQACPSMEARWLGLPSTEARRKSASIGSRVGILPKVLVDLFGPIGDRVGRNLLESGIVAQESSTWRNLQKYL